MGAWGLRAQRMLLVVDDDLASSPPRAALCTSQDPGAQDRGLLGRAPRRRGAELGFSRWVRDVSIESPGPRYADRDGAGISLTAARLMDSVSSKRLTRLFEFEAPGLFTLYCAGPADVEIEINFRVLGLPLEIDF